MPGSATLNCALLGNKQHLFLLISSSLSVSKFVSVGVCLFTLYLSLSLSNTHRCSLALSLSSSLPPFHLHWKVVSHMEQLMQSLLF